MCLLIGNKERNRSAENGPEDPPVPAKELGSARLAWLKHKARHMQYVLPVQSVATDSDHLASPRRSQDTHGCTRSGF